MRRTPDCRNSFKTTDGPRPSVEQALREVEAAFQEAYELRLALRAVRENDNAAPVVKTGAA